MKAAHLTPTLIQSAHASIPYSLREFVIEFVTEFIKWVSNPMDDIP